MSSQELELTLQDLNQKFKIIDTPQALETRAWMAHYLSILSEKRRDEIVKKLPDFTNMTAEQLSAELARVQEKRSSLERQKQDLDQTPVPSNNPWDPGAKQAMQAYYSDHSANVGGYYSPYRGAPAQAQRPFADVQPNKMDFGFSVGAYGGFRMYW